MEYEGLITERLQMVKEEEEEDWWIRGPSMCIFLLRINTMLTRRELRGFLIPFLFHVRRIERRGLLLANIFPEALKAGKVDPSNSRINLKMRCR